MMLAGSLVLAAGCADRPASIVAPSNIDTPSDASASQAHLQPDGITGRPGTTNIPVASTVTVTSLVSGHACPALRFMVSSYLFKTSTSTTYSGGSCADIKAGTVLSFTGTRVSNNELVIYLDAVALKGGSPEEEKESVEVEVTVGSVVGGTGCPYIQFEVSGTQLAATQNQPVPAHKRFGTDRVTSYDGGLCDDIGVGAKLRVSGTKRKKDEAVHVSAIVFKSKKLPPATPITGQAVVMRTLDDTKCPTLGFKLVTYTTLENDSSRGAARVTEATKYEGNSCESIKAGSTITFSGEKQADGSIVVLSAKVKEADLKDPDDGSPQVVEIGLKVSAVSADTTCPLLTFAAGSYTVKTSVDTEYVDGACANIAVGSRLLVQALLVEQVAPLRKAVPKTLLATRIQFKDRPAEKLR